MDGLATRLAELEPASERGKWQRHVATRYLASALSGRQADGRWGTKLASLSSTWGDPQRPS